MEIEKATYILIIELNKEKEIEIGSLGNYDLKKGFYSYTGSAFGPGGIKRIDNHLKILKGDKDRHRWHIDYLTSDKSSSAVKVFLTPEKAECKLAKSIQLQAIDDFGCSDCSCKSHLHHSKDRKIVRKVRKSFKQHVKNYKEVSADKFEERRF